MTHKTIWLVHFKARIGEFSPMNMDGSEFAMAIGIVSAETLAQVVVELDIFLVNQQLELVNIQGCEKYFPEQYSDDSSKSKEIQAAVYELSLKGINVTMASGVTSEAALLPHDVVVLMAEKNMSPIVAWRIHQGLSQREWGDRMGGLSQSAVELMEALGSNPPEVVLQRAANALEFRVEQLKI